jgi:hypothetical protein
VQTFIYALIQGIHNLGAVTVVGVAASALWMARDAGAAQHRLALLSAVAWAVQAATGVLFGISTFYFEGHLPDIHGIAVDALIIKIFCASSGFVLAVAYLKWDLVWNATRRILAWRVLLMLGVVALGSAAFLRWFS